MTKSGSIAVLTILTAITSANIARADFSGQTILGPLGPNSVVIGDTSDATDDNDGWDSGVHIFDLWNGPDDVWALNWPGGSLEVGMTYESDIFFDLDLFLYEPGSLDSTGMYSILNTGIESIDYPAAPAGTYYIVVDGYDGAAGPYELTVSPEPGTLALLGVVLAVVTRRSRKSH